MLDASTPPTPCSTLSSLVHLRRIHKRQLLARVRALEIELLHEQPADLVGVCVQDSRLLTNRTLRTYAKIARTGVHVRVFARGLHARLAPGVEGVDLRDDDPLASEWCLVVLGAAPVCLAARDLHEKTSVDGERVFSWGMSLDLSVVQAAAESLSRLL